MNPTPRTYLYVPADRSALVAKAADRGSDAVVLDLEDGIARSHHTRARDVVLEQVPVLLDRMPQVWVRPGPEDLEDPTVLLDAGIRRLVVPKVSAAVLDDLAHRADGDLEVIGLVETAATLVDLDAVARHPTLTRLGLGAADLAAELGLSPDRSTTLLAPARFQLVLASAAAGLPAPIAPTSLRLDEPTAVETSTRNLQAEGFGARTCVHPAQVPAVHAGLAPSPDELRAARAVIVALGAANPGSSGAVRTADGQMVDEAVARSARNVLARAGDQATDPSSRSVPISVDE